MSREVLEVEAKGSVLTFWMNRPEKRNALNSELVEALTAAFKDAEDREEVRVIVLRGRGPDFCAGADLAELEKTTAEGEEASLADARRLGALLLAVRTHPRPVVAAVQGKALAGGCGLATASDLVLASQDADFAYPEVHLGFVPAMVMAILRRKVTESRAFEMVAMGHRIPASEACRIGLVNRTFPADEFDGGVKAFVDELAERPREALTLIKGLLYELADLPVEAGVYRGAEVNVEARQTEACQAGVRAFLARRNPER